MVVVLLPVQPPPLCWKWCGRSVVGIGGATAGGGVMPLPAPDGIAGHGAYRPATTTGLSDVDDDAMVASLPNALSWTRPTKRVMNDEPGVVPARASARSSTPEPHVNAAGSMDPLVGVHVAPPGTRASAPAAHARPTKPLARDASRVAASHTGFPWPFASRK